MALDNPLTDPGTLQTALRRRVTELEEALLGLDDRAARIRPAANEWSVHEILVHLLGPNGGGVLHDLVRVLEEREPALTIDDGACDMTPGREASAASELAPMVRREYGALATFVGALGGRELARRASVRELAGTPTGARPTLTQYLNAIELHLGGHCEQIRSTRRIIQAA